MQVMSNLYTYTNSAIMGLQGVFARLNLADISDVEANIYKNYYPRSDVFSEMEYRTCDLGGIFATILKWLGWLIVKLLAFILDSVESLLNSVFKAFDFLFSSEMKEFFGSFGIYLLIPVGIVLIWAGYQMMFKSPEERPKLFTMGGFQNILLALLVLLIVPVGSFFSGNSAESFFKSTINLTTSTRDLVMEAGNDTEASYSDKIISDNVTDYLYIYAQATKATKNTTDAQDIPSAAKIPYPQLESGENVAVKTENNGELTYGKNVWDCLINRHGKQGEMNATDSGAGESKFNSVYVPLAGGFKQSGDGFKAGNDYIGKIVDINPAEIIYTKGCDSEGWDKGRYILDIAYKDGLFYKSEYNTDFFGNHQLAEMFLSYNFRYSIDYITLFITLIATIFITFVSSYKIAKILFDIAVHEFLAVFFAVTDFTNGEKLKEILKSVLHLLMTIVFNAVLLKLFFVASSYLNNSSVKASLGGPLPCAFILLFFALAAADGPDILQRIIGVDAGTRNAGHVLMGLYAGGRMAAGVASAPFKAANKITKSTAHGVSNCISKIHGYATGASNGGGIRGALGMTSLGQKLEKNRNTANNINPNSEAYKQKMHQAEVGNTKRALEKQELANKTNPNSEYNKEKKFREENGDNMRAMQKKNIDDFKNPNSPTNLGRRDNIQRYQTQAQQSWDSNTNKIVANNKDLTPAQANQNQFDEAVDNRVRQIKANPSQEFNDLVQQMVDNGTDRSTAEDSVSQCMAESQVTQEQGIEFNTSPISNAHTENITGNSGNISPIASYKTATQYASKIVDIANSNISAISSKGGRVVARQEISNALTSGVMRELGIPDKHKDIAVNAICQSNAIGKINKNYGTSNSILNNAKQEHNGNKRK